MRISHQHWQKVDRGLQEQLWQHSSHLGPRVYILSEVWVSTTAINPERFFGYGIMPSLLFEQNQTKFLT